MSIRSHFFLHVPYIEKSCIFSVNSESGQAKERIEADDIGEIYFKMNFVTVPFINTLLHAARLFSHARRVYLYNFQKNLPLYTEVHPTSLRQTPLFSFVSNLMPTAGTNRDISKFIVCCLYTNNFCLQYHHFVSSPLICAAWIYKSIRASTFSTFSLRGILLSFEWSCFIMATRDFTVLAECKEWIRVEKVVSFSLFSRYVSEIIK